jgi:cysteine desulfurase
MSSRQVYLDNNATTRVAPEVIEAMIPFMGELYANPSSAHTFGRQLRGAVEHAREQVAEIIGAADTGEIVFTSCGTESDNWAINAALELQPDEKHLVTTRVEHEAVRHVFEKYEKQGYEVSWIEVDRNCELDLDHLRDAIRPDTALVSVMLANNETGVLFPVEQIGKIVKERSDALFHVDGVQAVGKVPIDLKNWDVDLFALSGHKLHAPKGIGVLYVRSGLEIPSMIIGSSQEGGRRAGTIPMPSIIGLGRACELAREPEPHARIRNLRDRFEDIVLAKIPNARLNGTKDRNKRLPNTSYISFEFVEGESILAQLDEAGVYVSTGSACNSGAHTASPTLRAMNVPYTTAMGSIRFSFGRYNTEEEVDYTLEVLPGVISRLAAISPYEAARSGAGAEE